MAQQSTSAPNEHTKGTQGKLTREHQKAVINGAENTKGVDVDPHQKSIAEARQDAERPAGEYEISTGDRSIQRGANQESEHAKHRSE